jgi:hypothetical protein
MGRWRVGLEDRSVIRGITTRATFSMRIKFYDSDSGWVLSRDLLETRTKSMFQTAKE